MYYNPADPNQAVLRRGWTLSDIFLFWMSIFPGAGAWMLLTDLGWWRRSSRFNSADRRCVERIGVGFRVRRPGHPGFVSPLEWVFGGLGVGLFLIVMMVLKFASYDDSPVLVAGVHMSISACGLGYIYSKWRARLYRSPVLEVDRRGRVLRLKQGAFVLGVPFAVVSEVSVKPDGAEYACILTLTRADAVRVSYRNAPPTGPLRSCVHEQLAAGVWVATYEDADSAEALAAWLRERLAA